jgi:tRNA threonylcarbamoyladenosine biosynthesis protein TsaB
VKLLAFETATEACSVAIYVDGEIRERHALAPRQHTALALPWADELLAEAGLRKSQLDAIAVGVGPGAFTGVRLAVALAQGIAMALDKPVLAISTLATLAMQAKAATGERVAAAIDARMGEIYLGEFIGQGDGLVGAFGDERVLAPEATPAIDGDIIGVGTGFAANAGALVVAMGASLQRFDATALPHAADLARLAVRDFNAGKAMAPERIEPAYLRNKVALTLSEQGK